MVPRAKPVIGANIAATRKSRCYSEIGRDIRNGTGLIGGKSSNLNYLRDVPRHKDRIFAIVAHL